jgi:hypothetical protein
MLCVVTTTIVIVVLVCVCIFVLVRPFSLYKSSLLRHWFGSKIATVACVIQIWFQHSDVVWCASFKGFKHCFWECNLQCNSCLLALMCLSFLCLWIVFFCIFLSFMLNFCCTRKVEIFRCFGIRILEHVFQEFCIVSCFFT